MRANTRSILAVILCVAPQPACWTGPAGTTSTITIAIDGAGQVISRDGTFACSSDPSNPSGASCDTSTFVGWSGTASSSSYELCAIPASGVAFDSWDFVVAADCPGCGADDPEMGAIDVHGNDAQVRIDVNPGYDVYETVTAIFAPITANSGSGSTAGGSSCW